MINEAHTTYFSKGSISQPFLLGQFDTTGIVKPCALASAEPFCVIADKAAAGGEPVPVWLLGATPHAVRVVSGGAITLGADIYTAASGRVQSLPSAAGTYYKVGIALEAATAAGQEILAIVGIPQKLVVEQPI